MTGGMDNPVDVVVHARRRADLHAHVPPAPRRRQARRPDPRDLRRRLRQGPRRRSTTTRGPAPTLMPVLTHLGPAAPCGLHRYESDAVRHGVREQPVRLPVQPAQGHPARPRCPTGATFTTKDCGLPRLRQPRLPPDRRARGRRRQPARGRHRRLVQALLPDLAAREAGRARGDLSRAEDGAHKVEDPRAARSTGRSSKPANWRCCSTTRGPVVRRQAQSRLVAAVGEHGLRRSRRLSGFATRRDRGEGGDLGRLPGRQPDRQ